MAANGLALITPSSINFTGTSATITTGGSVRFTACGAVSLNGVFTSTYDNYVISLQASGNVATDLLFRWRTSGADDSTSNSYVSQRLTADSTIIAGIRVTSTQAHLGDHQTTLVSGWTVYAYCPNLPQSTAYRGIPVLTASSANIQDWTGTHNQSTAYDGLTVYKGSGFMTGRIKVYGLEQ